MLMLLFLQKEFAVLLLLLLYSVVINTNQGYKEILFLRCSSNTVETRLNEVMMALELFLYIGKFVRSRKGLFSPLKSRIVM